MSCSLVMLAGPSDAGTIRMMFRHADRMSRFPFQFRALTIDTLPSPSHPAGSLATAQLIAEAEDMKSSGEIDAVFRTSDPAEDIERKHFGHSLKRKRDFRNIPLLGWAIGIERAPTDFVCHFDSDILMHTSGTFSWVLAAITEIENHADILFVAPRGVRRQTLARRPASARCSPAAASSSIVAGWRACFRCRRLTRRGSARR